MKTAELIAALNGLDPDATVELIDKTSVRLTVTAVEAGQNSSHTEPRTLIHVEPTSVPELTP